MAKTKAIARPDLTPLVYEAAEVASMLAVTESTVQNLHRVGQLEGVKIGRHLRWRHADVVRFLDGLGNPSGGVL